MTQEPQYMERSRRQLDERIARAKDDLRYAIVAQALGVDRDEAIQRIEGLKQACAELEDECPTGIELVRWLGIDGADTLVRAQLGEFLSDGRVRVYGVARDVRGYAQRRAAAIRGGQKRKAIGIDRDGAGRFLPNARRASSRAAGSAPREALRKLPRIRDERDED